MNSNDEARLAVRRMMALPLAPSDHRMRAVLDANLNFIRNVAALRARFGSFIMYVQNQWFGTYQPEDYSVFKQEARTTNKVERFHLDFLHTVGQAHPTFWHFYGTYSI